MLPTLSLVWDNNVNNNKPWGSPITLRVSYNTKVTLGPKVNVTVLYPWGLVEQYEQDDNSIPPDLAKALGCKAVQMMWDRLSVLGEPRWVGESWWSHGLPLFVKNLLRDNAHEKERREAAESDREKLI